MRADAPDMDLRRWNDYYFEVGMRMAELCALARAQHARCDLTLTRPPYFPCSRRTDDEGLGTILLRGFVNRYRNLLGPALNATTSMDMRSRKAKLTLMERSCTPAPRPDPLRARQREPHTDTSLPHRQCLTWGYERSGNTTTGGYSSGARWRRHVIWKGIGRGKGGGYSLYDSC